MNRNESEQNKEAALSEDTAQVEETLHESAAAYSDGVVRLPDAAELSADGNPDGESAEENESFADNVRIISPMRLVMQRFFRSRLSMVGLVMMVLLLVFCFLGPVFIGWGETEVDTNSGAVKYTPFPLEYTDAEGNTYSAVQVDVFQQKENKYAPCFSKSVNKDGKTAYHILGTDDMGYDVLVRLMYGGRVSLTVGFVVVILETLFGVLLGGLAGYFGGWVDQVVMRVVDIFNCVPTLPMMMIVGVALEAKNISGPAKLYIMMAMLTLFGWAGIARLVRGQILSLREQDFMLSAEASGLTTSRKIFRHLVPNVLPQLIVSMTLGLGGIILTEATLGYLGIGLPAEYATWGNMINAAANNTALRLYPNLWVSPGICIVLSVLAFNFVGDGLRDAVDPKARR